MAIFQKQCDLVQGYRFRKDGRTSVGHITKLQIGTVLLAADQTVKNPLRPDENVEVVAVLDTALWELEPSDPLRFSGQVSLPSKQSLVNLLTKPTPGLELRFEFTIYDFDPTREAYYRCMYGTEGVELVGSVVKEGGDLLLAVADQPSSAIREPANFALHLGVESLDRVQSLTLAVASDRELTKPWGVAGSART